MRTVANVSRSIYASAKSSLNLSHVLRFLASSRHALHLSVKMPALCINIYAVLSTWALVNCVCICTAYSTVSSIFSNIVSIGMLILYAASILSFFSVRSGYLMTA